MTPNKFFKILRGLTEFTTRNSDGKDIAIDGKKFVSLLRPKLRPPQTRANPTTALSFHRNSEGGLRVLANNSYEGAGASSEGMSIMIDHVWYLTESHAIEAKKFEAAASVADGERREALLRHSGMFKGLDPFFFGSIHKIREAGRRITLNGDEMKEVRRQEVGIQTRICMFKMTQSTFVRRVLVASKGRTLLFEDSGKDRVSFWGGVVTPSNAICGRNELGEIWMNLRRLV
jgi:predicted NAD-dependent protein-ADP-ribosyltransferase YbiA (DUF1768 family)